MLPWKLLLLAIVSIVGAWLSAQQEAMEYAHQRKLNHLLLSCLRVTVAIMVLSLLLPDPVELPVVALCLTFMAGIFGPVHRVSLNLTRINRYFIHIPWHHLGTESKYDSLFRMLLRGNEKAAFLTMTTLELLIAAAMYQQLTP
jgi:hypothetical protein